MVLLLMVVGFFGCDLSALSGVFGLATEETEDGSAKNDKDDQIKGESAVVLLYRPKEGSVIDHDRVSFYQIRLFGHQRADAITVSSYKSGDRIRNVAEGEWGVEISAYSGGKIYALGTLDDQSKLSVGKGVTTTSFTLDAVTGGQTSGGGNSGEHDPNVFVTEWDTRKEGVSGPDRITLPFVKNGSYDVIVRWGDGNLSEITAWDTPAVTHIYVTGGVYTVQIRDRNNGAVPFTGWSFGRLSDGESQTDARKLLKVKNWGGMRFGDTTHHFSGARNMDIVAHDTPDLSETTSMEGSFAYTDSLVGNESFKKWDVSTITSFKGTFLRAFVFNADIASWDVRNATQLESMFAEAKAFNRPIGRWDIAGVTTLNSMFFEAENFNQPIEKWDTSSVTVMNHMFRRALSFNQPLNSWDTSNVTQMSKMFAEAKSFNQPLDAWDTSKVTDMTRMFHSASSFNKPLFPSIISVKGMTDMFWGAKAFNRDVSGWDFSSVTMYKNESSSESGFMINTGISDGNYNKLLIRLLETAQTPTGKAFVLDASAQATTSEAKAARNGLINKGWMINDET